MIYITHVFLHFSRSDCIPEPSSISNHLNLWFSVPPRIPKSIVLCNHSLLNSDFGLCIPIQTFSFNLFLFSSDTVNGSVAFVYPLPFCFSSFRLDCNTALLVSNSRLYKWFYSFRNLSIDQWYLVRVSGSYSDPSAFRMDNRNDPTKLPSSSGGILFISRVSKLGLICSHVVNCFTADCVFVFYIFNEIWFIFISNFNKSWCISLIEISVLIDC